LQIFAQIYRNPDGYCVKFIRRNCFNYRESSYFCAMNCILFDDPLIRRALLPLTFTRPVSGIRTGIVTIVEKWQHFLSGKPSFLTEAYLQTKFPQVSATNNLYINGAVCPDEALTRSVLTLKMGENLVQNGLLIAFRTEQVFDSPVKLIQAIDTNQGRSYDGELAVLRQPYDIFVGNGAQIKSDFAWITSGRESTPANDPYTRIYNAEQVFIEEGASVIAAVLNAQSGPIYIGKNAQVQEGSLIRGAFAIGEGSMLCMGSKMRGDITIGPGCKIGGEVSNSIVFGNSNKGHEGYLGNSVLGEWCNLGADTNTSNMKNDYGTVKIWSYAQNTLVDTGRQFCGLLMGDHSKAGINTMFNTGTVVGVSANIFGGDFPPKHVPSFTWGGAQGLEVFRLDKALEVAGRVMQRRNQPLEATDTAILTEIFNQTHQPTRRIGFV
jgi:UDP-N-acetylglucosamine diphosphorylase/glucosamine-1-phosphate N-acetyltransferase